MFAPLDMLCASGWLRIPSLRRVGLRAREVDAAAKSRRLGSPARRVLVIAPAGVPRPRETSETPQSESSETPLRVLI